MLEADVFAMPAIEHFQNTRTARIHDLLRKDRTQSPPTPGAAERGLRYAIAHHMLEGAEASARSGDTETFDWYRRSDTDALNLSTVSVVGRRVVVVADINTMQRSSISETPYLMLGPHTTSAPRQLLDLTINAIRLASNGGFSRLVGGHAAVVCLLRAKQLGTTLDSWTISRLPSTVFVDHVSDPAILARDLIHEAAHNWLNDALSALEIKIDEDTSFFSPWKGTHRPAFGFIHACWAFPLTMIYTAAALDQVTGPVHDYLGAYLGKQAKLLAATPIDHNRALDLIPDLALRDTLRTVYEAAGAIRS
jgi:HEXXH motif-containing protein